MSEHLETSNAPDADLAEHATPKVATTAQSQDGSSPGAVGTWLDGLVRVMRLPKRESDEIREELDSHIRERVRDLMLIGESEPKAIHHAISELGDAALLAQRYKQARGISQRRWIMTAATFAIASGALVLSTMTLSGSPMLPSGTTQESQIAPLTAMPIDNDLLEHVLSMKVELEEQTQYGEFFDMIRDAAGGSIVDNSVFDEFTPDDEMGVSANGVSIGLILAMLNRRFDYDSIALLPIDGGVQITTQREIDHIQSRLVAYDIEPILDEGVDPDELTELIIGFVEPDHWIDNGGELASYQVVGYRLFVQAPPRFLPRIEWMMDQLGAEATEQADAELNADMQLAYFVAGEMRSVVHLMTQYAAETGELPTTFSELRGIAERHEFSIDNFLTPAVQITAEWQSLGDINLMWNYLDFKGSYVIVEGELYDGTSELLIERTPNVPGKRIVAYGDGHVEIHDAPNVGR